VEDSEVDVVKLAEFGELVDPVAPPVAVVCSGEGEGEVPLRLGRLMPIELVEGEEEALVVWKV